MRLEKNKTPQGRICPSSSHRVIHPPTQCIHIIQGTRFRAIFLELGATSHTLEPTKVTEKVTNPRQRPGFFAPILGDGLGMVLRGPKPCVIQVQTLPLEAPVILRGILFEVYPRLVEGKAMGFILSGLESPSLEKRMSNHT